MIFRRGVSIYIQYRWNNLVIQENVQERWRHLVREYETSAGLAKPISIVSWICISIQHVILLGGNISTRYISSKLKITVIQLKIESM